MPTTITIPGMRPFIIPSLVDVCVEIVEGKRDGGGKYDLAVKILRYVQQQRATGESEDAIESDVYRLWHSDEPKYYSVKMLARLETVKDAQDVEQLVIISTPAPAKDE